MRKKSREVTSFKAMTEIMEKCDVCRLALNDSEVPYILPLNFTMSVGDPDADSNVAEDGLPTTLTLYFHGASEGRKYELIALNPECSFEMDCEHEIVSDRDALYCTYQYSSVIGRGKISIVSDEEKVAVLQELNNRYHPGMEGGFPVNMPSVPHVTVMKLEVSNMTAKSNVGKINMPSYMAKKAEPSKAEKYELLLKQVRSVTDGETDMVAVMSNVSAMIHQAFGFWWTGFYIVRDCVKSDGTPSQELVLGPFQGPVACTHIKKGRGVCGTAWAKDSTIVVPDVEQFPGHIACSSASRSEIVVPIHDASGAFVAELDIDSEKLATFDEVDAEWLEKIMDGLWR